MILRGQSLSEIYINVIWR